MQKKRKKTGELQLFREIAIERGLYSEKSGVPLDGVPSNFCHILRKGKFPEAKYNKENIILLSCREHNIFDNEVWLMEGDKQWGWILRKRERLLKQYLKKKPDYCKPGSKED